MLRGFNSTTTGIPETNKILMKTLSLALSNDTLISIWVAPVVELKASPNS
jgi:hypothetical protein